MSAVEVTVDAGRVSVGLGDFSAGVADIEALLKIIAAGQLVSVRRTFDEGGSPSGSWKPLSPVSQKWRKYTSGHKLLIGTGRGLSSVQSAIYVGGGRSRVVIGTGVKYMLVQNNGYSGPQSVRAYSYTRRVKGRDRFGRVKVTNTFDKALKTGKLSRTVKRKVSSGITTVNVKAFTRRINIPARPFLVFRPEDPQRIREEVQIYIDNAARRAGLAVS